MNPVVLTPEEMIACRLIGNLRTLGSISGKSKSTPYSNVDLADMNEYSFFGEYAFAKSWNIFFDITAQPRKGGCDCVITKSKSDGTTKSWRVDVKTTKVQGGKLLVKNTENSDVDIYALAILKDDTVTFPGYCTIDRLHREGTKRNNIDGTFYWEMPQDQLTPWK